MQNKMGHIFQIELRSTDVEVEPYQAKVHTIQKNNVEDAKLINLSQESEGLSIRVAAGPGFISIESSRLAIATM